MQNLEWIHLSRFVATIISNIYEFRCSQILLYSIGVSADRVVFKVFFNLVDIFRSIEQRTDEPGVRAGRQTSRSSIAGASTAASTAAPIRL